jgi:hypothetical protein
VRFRSLSGLSFAFGIPEEMNIILVVTPARAGVPSAQKKLDSRFRGNDER